MIPFRCDESNTALRCVGSCGIERRSESLIDRSLRHSVSARRAAQKVASGKWRGGRYFEQGNNPRRGLAVARMGAHITYLSDAALHRKFGRRFQDRDNHFRWMPTFG